MSSFRQEKKVFQQDKNASISQFIKDLEISNITTVIFAEYFYKKYLLLANKSSTTVIFAEYFSTKYPLLANKNFIAVIFAEYFYTKYPLLGNKKFYQNRGQNCVLYYLILRVGKI